MSNTIDISLYIKKIKYFFQAKNISREDIEDLTQESICRVYENIHKFNGNSSISTWIFSICKNVLYESYRKSPNVSSLEFEPAIKDTDKEKIELDIILSKMPGYLKRVYDRKYRLNMKIKEISAELNIPEGTIKYYIHQIKEYLKLNYAIHPRHYKD